MRDGAMVAPTPAGYRQFDELGLRRYVAALPGMRERLGGTPGAWDVREVGDGNLNLVFLIDGPAGGICVKQSLPHIRALKTWRLPVERTFFEHAYFALVGPLVGNLVPAIYHYEPELFAITMEQLTPHVILRRGLIAGQTYPRVAIDVAEFIARASFFTSDIGTRFESKYAAMATFARNHGLLRITTDLVFCDPYCDVERNRWTSPQLDDIALAFRTDAPLKAAVARLGHAFLANTQALIHGDLHSGSVMVTATDTRIIDPEFALYGPIGFDVGAFIGNLLLNAFAQPGYATAGAPRAANIDWVLAQIPRFWEHFRARFLELWETSAAGDAFPPQMFADPRSRAELHLERERFIAGVYRDAIGFAAAKMIRRILGFAHVIDFEEIPDPDRRAACERTALTFARRMLTAPEQFATTADLVAAAHASGTAPHAC
jgi:5-methylthioribose kinase